MHCGIVATLCTQVMHPCSMGWADRWVWLQVGPAAGRQDCTLALPWLCSRAALCGGQNPPGKNIGRSNIQDATTQAFCANVPDGFMCPAYCENTRAPCGELRCKNGKWSQGFRCRPKRKASWPSQVACWLRGLLGPVEYGRLALLRAPKRASRASRARSGSCFGSVQVTIVSANGQNFWDIRGVVPDKQLGSYALSFCGS